LLEEVEQVADHVTMIHQGTIALSAPLHEIKESHRCLTVRFAEPRPQPPVVAGVLRWDGGGQEWTAVYRGSSAELQAAVAGWGAGIVAERVPSLDEIFVAQVGMAATSAADA
jgi:ABC-2 type transport system ATP-binding protein